MLCSIGWGLDTTAYDVIIYDVLGDVVCGGFAVPLRKGFADRVYIVTSEEFMALYAANNILRGVRNFEDNGSRLAGLILNSRGADEDPDPVHRFALATGLPIVCHIPRSDRFRKAEEQHRTVIEAFPESQESALFRELGRKVLNYPPLYPARPLSDTALERSVFLKESVQCGMSAEETVTAPAERIPLPTRMNQEDPLSECSMVISKSMLFRQPLHGCAFTGAISTTTQIQGTITVAHGPRSCAYIAAQTILSSALRARQRTGLLLPRQLAPSLQSSDMNERVVIYGGGENLSQSLREALVRRPEAVFVITSCPSGVIGDDSDAAIGAMHVEFPDVPIIPITTDGNIHGDYMQGVLNACIEGASALINSKVKPVGNRVNILAEKNIANNAESNFSTISELLRSLNIEVNCRFVRHTSAHALRDFGKARVNLLAYQDHFGRVLQSFFSERFGAVFATHPFPVGFAETERWLYDIAGFFSTPGAARKRVEAHRHRYKTAIQNLRPFLAGKRIMIVSYIHDVDWILETVYELDMEVEKVGILNSSQDYLFRTRFRDRFEVETDYTPQKRDADLERILPDLLLCNYVPERLPVPIHVDGIPFCPNVGFYGGLAFARRWAALLKSPIREGWRDDGLPVA